LPVRLLPRTRRRARARGTRLSADARRILAVQAVRALAYGLGSVLIGVTLADRGLSDGAVGLVLASLLAGTALVSILIARYGDRVGRRRCYRLLLVAMALAGTVFALTDWLPMLILAGLTGALSTEVVESGPFTSLEQAMLPHAARVQERTATNVAQGMTGKPDLGSTDVTKIFSIPAVDSGATGTTTWRIKPIHQPI